MWLKKSRNRRRLLVCTVFVSSLCVCLFVTGLYVYNRSRVEHAQMEQIVLVNGNKINNVISKLLYKTQVLAALVVQNDGAANDFQKVAAAIVDDPAIKNVLLAPDGVVSDVYPLEGNEGVLGFHFFEEGNGNLEAIQARDTGQLVLGGPFELVQGGQALVGRLPVYIRNSAGSPEFWGLVSVTLHYPQALEGAELDQLKNHGFAFEIWRISPDTNERQIIANSSYDYNHNAPYVEKSITVLNAAWQFRISPIRSWYEFPETWIFGVCGALLSCLAAFLALNNYDLKVMQGKLETLTSLDPLTGIMNRRGLLSSLDELLNDPKTPFLLCYIDLDSFKQINDQYGHNAGDIVLQQFSSVIQKRIGNDQIFARIGGDEFVIVFKGIEDPNAVQPFFDGMKTELKEISEKAEAPVPISFSVGKALFPSQSQSIHDLLHYADSDMYRNKPH